MKTPNLPPHIFVEDQAGLNSMIEDLSQEAALGIDTEANGLHAYQEQVCLIQISTIDQDYLVDPLAIEDLSPLGAIFSDPKIEKIFHASEYDIIMLAKDFDYKFTNLFDTMLASLILGRDKVGLGTLLEELMGIRVNKRFQKADWGKRPIQKGMLNYAQTDTHYLIDLRNILHSQLNQAGLWPLAKEDFALACHAHERSNGNRLPPCWRGNGPKDLTPQKAAVYKKLCEYRNGIAQKRNKPLFKVFSQKILVTLAEECPKNQQELQRIKGIPRWMIQRHGSEIVKTIHTGLKADPYSISYPKRPSKAYLNRVQSLQQWRKSEARKMGVNSAVILPRELLDAVAAENPSTKADLAKILAEVPWRLEHFGEDILRIVRNH